MSEFKFACPVCGQHIECESNKAGTQLECPTCFRKIIVPQAPADPSKIILSGTQAHSPRPNTQVAAAAPRQILLARKLPVTAVAAVVLVCAAGAFVVFRGEIVRPAHHQATDSPTNRPRPTGTVLTAPPANDTNWMLNLETVGIPETRAAGRISGKDFICQRATIQGGILSLRQGTRGSPDLGLTILLLARQGEELAGKSIAITTNRGNAPHLVLRWKDDQQRAMTRNIDIGYALRLDFGQAASNRITVKMYLCLPDQAKSYVAGTFEAEIRTPQPPRPRPQIPR